MATVRTPNPADVARSDIAELIEPPDRPKEQPLPKEEPPSVKKDAPRTGENEDAQARAIVETWYKAVLAKDLKEVMKTVDVPFFTPKGKLIRDRGELEKDMDDMAKHFDAKAKLTITRVT